MGLDSSIFAVNDKLEKSVEVMYWRKANWIHKWFVDNVQNGIDDCSQYRLTADDIKKFLDVCRQVLETKDSSLMPPTGGFFFGSTEIDGRYFRSIADSIDQLKIIESEYPESDDWILYYVSSW